MGAAAVRSLVVDGMTTQPTHPPATNTPSPSQTTHPVNPIQTTKNAPAEEEEVENAGAQGPVLEGQRRDLPCVIVCFGGLVVLWGWMGGGML